MALNHFSYRGYNHPPGETTPESFDTRVERNERGIATKVTRSMSIRVQLVATGDTNINQRVREIEQAYGSDGGDAVFFLSDGSASEWQIRSASSLYGVVVDGPHWNCDPREADWVTGLSCTINLSAEYAPFGVVNPFAGRADSIEVIGTGGPAYKLDRLDNGPPQVKLIHPATEVYVVQSGEAVNEYSLGGIGVYPSFPQYLFPDNILNPLDIRQNRRKPRDRNGKTQYVSAWTYTFTFTRYPFVPSP